jgi:tetratricopeptide (TPR) repeat protein
MKRTILLAACLLACAEAANAAQATLQQVDRRCHDYALRAPEQIGACAAMIRLLGDSTVNRPQAVLAYLARATGYARAGDRMRSEPDFREAVRLASIPIDGGERDPISYNDRCWARAVANIDLDAALADCNEALQLRPDFMPAVDSRAFIHMRRGRFREAIADYDTVLKDNPRNQYSLYGRGIAKLRSGDTAGGQADIAASKEVQDVSAEFTAYGFAP